MLLQLDGINIVEDFLDVNLLALNLRDQTLNLLTHHSVSLVDGVLVVRVLSSTLQDLLDNVSLGFSYNTTEALAFGRALGVWSQQDDVPHVLKFLFDINQPDVILYKLNLLLDRILLC